MRKVLEYVLSIQPHQLGEGNHTLDSLWLLHKLWCIDKHRHLVTSPLIQGGGAVAHDSNTSGEAQGHLRAMSDQSTHASFLFVPDDTSVDVQAYITIAIIMEGTSKIRGRPVMLELRSMLERVATVVVEVCERA